MSTQADDKEQLPVPADVLLTLYMWCKVNQADGATSHPGVQNHHTLLRADNVEVTNCPMIPVHLQ